MIQGFDARGIKTSDGIDARGIEPAPDAPACPECGAALRAGGPGRRPVYCSRSCSSKAYRRRRMDGQQAAVADALIASRVEIPDTADAAADADARELLHLAEAMQRAAARFLQNLEDSRRGGIDDRGTRALELLERSTAAITERVLRKASAMRFEMLTDRRAQQAADAAAAAHSETVCDSSRVESNSAPSALIPTRVESSSAAPALVSTRVETGGVAEVAGPVLVSSRVENREVADGAGVSLVSPRVETVAARAAAPVQRRPLYNDSATPLHPDLDASAGTDAVPGESDTEGAGLLLALERTSVSPLARGLGAPSRTGTAEDGTFTVTGWDQDPGVLLVRLAADNRVAGWVADLGNHWGTYIDGSLVIDATDGRPRFSPTARDAITLLRTALGRHIE